TSSLEQITKAIRALMSSHANGLKDSRTQENTKFVQATMGVANAHGICCCELLATLKARIAVMQVVIPKGEPVELLPRSPHIMSLQMDFIRKYQLETERLVHIRPEPEARLRILPYHTRMDVNNKFIETIGTDSGIDDFISATGDTNGSPYPRPALTGYLSCLTSIDHIAT
ncbi:hypothetical protein D5086_003299, partial [Populus alba]